MHHKKIKALKFGLYGFYRTIWIDDNGKLKIRQTKWHPQVRVSNNLRHSLDQYMDYYKDVEVGDIDYYGWICIEITWFMSLTDNPALVVEYPSETMNKAIYSRLMRNHKQQQYRSLKNLSKKAVKTVADDELDYLIKSSREFKKNKGKSSE